MFVWIFCYYDWNKSWECKKFGCTASWVSEDVPVSFLIFCWYGSWNEKGREGYKCTSLLNLTKEKVVFVSKMKINENKM